MIITISITCGPFKKNLKLFSAVFVLTRQVYPTTLTYYLLQAYPDSVNTSYVVKERLYKQG